MKAPPPLPKRGVSIAKGSSSSLTQAKAQALTEAGRDDDDTYASSTVSKASSKASSMGSIVLPPNKMLKSKKWDMTRFMQPELRWDFYDSYQRSKPVRDARSCEINSIEGNNLDIIFKRSILKAGKSALDSFLEATSEEVISPYPPPFDELIPLQDGEGKWQDLPAVLRILRLPKSYSLDRATEWEQATAFAIASIRQRLDLFELLAAAHDKARVWMGSGEFIYQARELILMTELTRAMAHGGEADENNDLLKIEKQEGLTAAELEGLHEQYRAEDEAQFGPKFAMPALEVHADDTEGFFLPRPAITKMSFLQSTLTEDTTEGVEVKQSSSVISSSEAYLAQMQQMGVAEEKGGEESKAGAKADVRAGDAKAEASVQEQQADEAGEKEPSVAVAAGVEEPDSSTRANGRIVSFALPEDGAEGGERRDNLQAADSPRVPAYAAASEDEVTKNRASWGLVAELAALSIDTAPPSSSRPATPSSPSSNTVSAVSPVTPKSPKAVPSFDSLQSRLKAISPQKDQAKIAQTKRELSDAQIRLVDAVVAIDAHVDAMHCALLDAVEYFNTCITFEERNTSFELLTAMLGDDYPAREGFVDWRGRGTPGLRPLMLTFFSHVHRLAELRLQLEELETPEGRTVLPGGDSVYDQNRYRWTFMYNGVDVVLKVMHCCDFLRRCREFCNNYGKKFFFTGNPLMMPFDMLRALHDIPEMVDKVQEQLATKAHVRPSYSFGNISSGFLAVSVAPGTDGAAKWAAVQQNNWKLDKFLERFKKDVLSMCKARGFNWPNAPVQQLKDGAYVKQLYTALLVIFVRQRESVESTLKWEKEFIQLSTTLRGQNLMIGKSGLKPDLTLPLPSSVLINTKNALMGIALPPPEPEEDEPDEHNQTRQRKRKPAPPPVIHQRKAPGAVGGAHPVRVEAKEVSALSALMGELAQAAQLTPLPKKKKRSKPITLADVLAPVKRVEHRSVEKRAATAEPADTPALDTTGLVSSQGSTKSKKVRGGKRGLRLSDVVGESANPAEATKLLATAVSDSTRVSRTASLPAKGLTRRQTEALAPIKK